jgi:hypothetical protein
LAAPEPLKSESLGLGTWHQVLFSLFSFKNSLGDSTAPQEEKSKQLLFPYLSPKHSFLQDSFAMNHNLWQLFISTMFKQGR